MSHPQDLAPAAGELATIVVRVAAHHPTGSRSRAGHRFHSNPSHVVVDAAQFDEIANDPYLIIVEGGTAHEQGMENPAEVLQLSSDSTIPAAPKDDGSKGGDGLIDFSKLSEAQIEKIKKDDLIEQLELRGQKEGEHFDKESKKADLVALLLSL